MGANMRIALINGDSHGRFIEIIEHMLATFDLPSTGAVWGKRIASIACF